MCIRSDEEGICTFDRNVYIDENQAEERIIELLEETGDEYYLTEVKIFN